MQDLKQQSRPFRVTSGRHPFNTLPQHQHCWKNNPSTGFLDPIWPCEPDIKIARELAVACLPSDRFSDAQIEPFANGSFHRLYRIWSNLSPNQYLMRVALPVEPFFKTESEVATMEYIRWDSNIPVPVVVAFDSSASNPLGFEWIFMEKVNGVPIEQVWNKMSSSAKVELTVIFASKMRRLLQRRFTLLGSIYFADVWNQVGYIPLPAVRQAESGNPLNVSLDIGIGDDEPFVIGRMISTRFFRDKRLLLRADRGPFASTRELVLAETELLGQRLRHLSPSPQDPYYCETDQELNKAGVEVLDTLDHLEKVASTRALPSHANAPEDTSVLWHDDLLRMNVLVDPITYRLAGVVDWESASTVPAWEVGVHAVPDFLRGIEVDKPPPLGSVSEEEEEELAMIRQDWELVELRRIYTAISRPLYDSSLVSEAALDLKKHISTSLGEFEDRWESTRYWLTHQLDKAEDKGQKAAEFKIRIDNCGD